MLKTLDHAARNLVTTAFLTEGIQADFTPFEHDFPRPVDLDPLSRLLEHAMAEFNDPPAADQWLAPRVHASLRLTRREASDKNLWSYLGLVQLQEYVRWRFANAPESRFVGSPHDHAVGR